MLDQKTYFKDKSIIVTGGVGSVGREIVDCLKSLDAKTIRVIDNNESALFDMEMEYKGKLMKLYYKASNLHLMILNLVKLIKKLESVIAKNKKVFVCGNAYFNDNMLESLMKLKTDFKKKGTIEVKEIQETKLTELIKNKSLIKSGKNYTLTRKGLIIDIAE